MTYTLYFTDEAKEELAGLKKNEPAAFKKAKALLPELQQHPMTGSGKPKPWVMVIEAFFSEELLKNTGLFIPLIMKKYLY